MKALIGVDIGTQGTKAALFTEEGNCLSQAFEASRLHKPRPGVVEEDPERQFTSVCRTIRRCIRESGIDRSGVVGIGIDGQMAGVLGVGKEGKHVTPYDSWLDTRCSEQIKQMDRIAGDEVLAKTGCPPSFNHGPKKLWWLQTHKNVYRRIAAFVQPGGYAAMRLCGLDGSRAFIDETYLQFSGFADNRRSCWDDGLCETLGMDRAKLATIVAPESVVGELTSSAARRCGLKSGVPVIAGCGDTAASFLACGGTRVGIGIGVAGTASVFAATTTEFRADKKHRTIGCGRSAVPGLWHPYAYINGGGMNLEWFRQKIVGAGCERGREPLTLEQLDQMAAATDPRDGLPMFVPHLGGRVCPAQPDLRGAWTGLSWDHSAGHLYRAMLESVALEYGIYARVLEELFPRFRLSELRITGGGQRSDLWNQIKADVLQIPVRKIARSEGAPLGVALVAGYGVGLFRSLPATAKRWISSGRATRPRKSMAAYYARRLTTYQELIDQLA
ncbi:MAG: FGGY-family carbohydrate kinase [Pirellulales bacterium]